MLNCSANPRAQTGAQTDESNRVKAGLWCWTAWAGTCTIAASGPDHRQRQMCEALHAEYHLVTPWLVEHLHRHGYRVRVWTVDSPTEMRRLVKMGVDAGTNQTLDNLVAYVQTAPN